MIGFGPEANHFVIELTYNYGVREYELGNDLRGITLRCNGIVDRARELNYPVEEEVDGKHVLVAPDGYKFFIERSSGEAIADPVREVILSSSDLDATVKYWSEILGMRLIERTGDSARLSYVPEQGFVLKFLQLDTALNRAKAYGRIAFAVPWDAQPAIDEKIQAIKGTILTPLITLDTPGKATVRVIILGDPDGHEICFVDEEGFAKLSEVDPKSDAALEKYIQKDPFQK